MGKHLAIIQGHPDPQGNHYGHALAAAYAQSAAAAGHEVQIIDVARLEFPLLRTKEDFEHGAPPDSICQAQQTIRWAEHLLIFYPLWGGTMPALLKGFLEQVFRPNFISDRAETGKSWNTRLLRHRADQREPDWNGGSGGRRQAQEMAEEDAHVGS
jgi:putative NADPH-quinone reductase